MSGLVHENPGPPAFTADGLPIGEAASLPPACYTDDDFLAREFRGIFRPSWCGVGRGDRVAEARSYAAFDLAGVPVLLIRDGSGVLRAFANSCRHRGTKLAADGTGKCRAIHCPFHSWSYGLDGALIAALNMDENFRLEDYGLTPIACAERHGFIFVNLDSGAPDIDSYLGDFGQRHAPWGLGDLVVWIRHMVPMGQSCEVIRQGAGRAAMLAPAARRATLPVGSQGRPRGRVSRPLGASDALDDAPASPAHALLPRRRETRSHGCHMSNPYH